MERDISKESTKNSKSLSAKHQMIASCSGALLTSVFMTPLDVVKVRLQAQQKELLKNRCFLYCNGLMDHICSCQPSTGHTQKLWYSRSLPQPITGTLDGLTKIARYEGVSSLWSGLPPTLLIAIPSTVIYFTSYEQIKKSLEKFSLCRANDGSAYWWVPGVSGGVARTWAVTVCSPVELVRTKLQATDIGYRELTYQMKKQVRLEGVRYLWRGWMPTILRDVPFSMLYWGSYEQLKKMAGQQHCPTVPVSMVSGAIAGGFAGTLTLPFDVVKTHRQIEIGEQELFPATTSVASASKKRGESSSLFNNLAEIYRKQGVKGLFSGLGPRLVKVMPACAIMISTYEYIKQSFR